MTLNNRTALIVVDVQQGFDDPAWGERNNPHAEQQIGELLAAWRGAKRPIYHVQHHSQEPNSPLRPDGPGVDFQPAARPQGDEPIIIKNVNSAFIGTDLESRLRAAKIDSVVFCGLTTPHCVSTSARMAGNFGFTTYVVADATAAHAATTHDGTAIPAEQVHTVALANLHGEFATVMTTNDLLQKFNAS